MFFTRSKYRCKHLHLHLYTFAKLCWHQHILLSSSPAIPHFPPDAFCLWTTCTQVPTDHLFYMGVPQDNCSNKTETSHQWMIIITYYYFCYQLWYGSDAVRFWIFMNPEWCQKRFVAAVNTTEWHDGMRRFKWEKQIGVTAQYISLANFLPNI